MNKESRIVTKSYVSMRENTVTEQLWDTVDLIK